jgi:hypothetical protein
LAAVRNQSVTTKSVHYTEIDQRYQTLRENMLTLLNDFLIAPESRQNLLMLFSPSAK